MSTASATTWSPPSQLELWPWMPAGPCPLCRSPRPDPERCERCKDRRRTLHLDKEAGWLSVRAQRAADRSEREREQAAKAQAIADRLARLRGLGRPARIALVGCGRSKRTGRHPAAALYKGQLFRAAYAHACRTADEVYILSGFHGLVRPDEQLDAYDRHLADLCAQEIAAWCARVRGAVHALCEGLDVEITVYAGADYARAAESLAVDNDRITVALPLRGLGVGERLGWFRRQRELAGALELPTPPKPTLTAPTPTSSPAHQLSHVTSRTGECAAAVIVAGGARAAGSEIPVLVGRHYVVAEGQVRRVERLPPVVLGARDAARLAAGPGPAKQPRCAGRRCRTNLETVGALCASCTATRAERERQKTERAAAIAAAAERRRIGQLQKAIRRAEEAKRVTVVNRSFVQELAQRELARDGGRTAFHCAGLVGYRGGVYPGVTFSQAAVDAVLDVAAGPITDPVLRRDGNTVLLA